MYVISYDISVDRLRNKIADTLLNYGRRVQYSVFECDITRAQYEELYQKLAILAAQDETGSIRFYSICEKCRKLIVVFGNQKNNVANNDILII